MGCCGSKKRFERLNDVETVEPSRDVLPPQRPAEIYYETEWKSSHKREEHEFFQIFFSTLEHVRGYQGILRRWEKEVQRADYYNGGKFDMSNVWTDGTRYIKTLRRVRELVSDDAFTWSDCNKLSEWAAKVVKRREAEYNSARKQGRADNQHRNVLDQWKTVRNTIQNLL